MARPGAIPSELGAQSGCSQAWICSKSRSQEAGWHPAVSAGTASAGG